MPSIPTCASPSWLVHLKSDALLGSQFSTLFALVWLWNVSACVLFFCSSSSAAVEFHLICDPSWDSCPVWGAICLNSHKSVLCSLQAPARVAAPAPILKGVILVICILALGTEHWAKIVPGTSASKARAYLAPCCWFYCYSRMFGFSFRCQP